MYFGMVDEVNHYGYDDGDNLFEGDENDSLLEDMDPERRLNPEHFTQEQKLHWLGLKEKNDNEFS